MAKDNPKKVKVTIKCKGRARVWNTGNGAVSLRRGGHYELPSKVAEHFIAEKWAVRGYVDLYPSSSPAPKRGRPKK